METRATTSEKSLPTEFRDDIVHNLLLNCIDSINAAWNGWEDAVKYEDDRKMNYYMKIITECQNFRNKLQHAEKVYNKSL